MTRTLPFLLVLTLVSGCETGFLDQIGVVKGQAVINSIQGPSAGTLGKPVAMTLHVAVGSDGSYTLGDVKATVDDQARTVMVSASNKRRIRFGASYTMATVEEFVSLAFTPQATGTYVVTAMRQTSPTHSVEVAVP